ncbi:unnamed protein product, partial [Chrysoparadoxa australica]
KKVELSLAFQAFQCKNKKRDSRANFSSRSQSTPSTWAGGGLKEHTAVMSLSSAVTLKLQGKRASTSKQHIASKPQVKKARHSQIAQDVRRIVGSYTEAYTIASTQLEEVEAAISDRSQQLEELLRQMELQASHSGVLSAQLQGKREKLSSYSSVLRSLEGEFDQVVQRESQLDEYMVLVLGDLETAEDWLASFGITKKSFQAAISTLTAKQKNTVAKSV